MKTLLIPLIAAMSVAATAAPPPKTTPPAPKAAASSCISCHSGDMFDDAARKKMQHFGDDVHAQAGLSCHDCHGGNPNASADDAMGAMDPKFAANPFRGAPKRTEIPEFCGRCHSSAVYMKRFNPAARVDEVTEYWTSVHGRRLKQGDENVATCVDCHSVHDIRRKSNPEAPVYATHVAETCSRCHSDAKRMAAYPIPTDQYARWKVSVHANALLNKGDMVAPTCNDCHGNHGATPPGVESVSFVCGNCHTREAELFRKSAKFAGWQQHNEFLASSTESCAGCHDDARASVKVPRLNGCVTCHENHAILRPTVAMVGTTTPDTPCAFCHEGTGPLSKLVAEIPSKATHYQSVRADLIHSADVRRLSGDARFDWFVDQALRLPPHRFPASRGQEELRPEFARLFEKFRIGKTHYEFKNPDGTTVDVTVRRCGQCHLTTDAAGTLTAQDYLGAERGLTSMIARAERILLSARRGGVEVGQARAELDSAVDNQIELETLVHTFSLPGEAQKKYDEGLQHAKAALISAQHSLDELQYRRKGLFIALGVIIIVLAALALKIRTL